MIELKNISVLRGKNIVLDNFSFTFPKTGGTLIVGNNGAGKSTLIRAISGELKIQSGSILIDEKNISKLKIKELVALRNVVPQTRSYLFNYQVGELLELPLIYGKANPKFSEISKVLKLDLKARINELSIGQQQRVSIAMALSVVAPYYLLDEPLAAQDATHIAAISEILLDLSTTSGVLVVSHGVSMLNNGFSNICSVE